MNSWQTGAVDVNGVRIHYTRTGGDLPPLVLAHGFSDDGLCWTPVAEALAPEFDVVMVDARGHGKSDAPESGYGQLDLAADLYGVIVGLGLERPAILGHSMGGATTMALAGMYPETPGTILIEDAGTFNMGLTTASSPEQQKRWEGMRKWATGLKRKTYAELLTEQRTATPHWSDAELGPWVDSKHRMSLNVLNRSDATPVDWPTLLPRITCPALLITADPARGAMVTKEAAENLRSLIPRLRIAHVSEAGHSIRRDQFAAYMTVVRDFRATWNE